jgi:hypothetical protein
MCVAITSSAYAGGIAPMEKSFGGERTKPVLHTCSDEDNRPSASSEVLLLGITFYVLGFAIGQAALLRPSASRIN